MNDDDKKTKELFKTIFSFIIMIIVIAFIYNVVKDGFNYVSKIDFSLPEISLFGESEKDKKIKKLEGRIKRLESNRGTRNEIRELKKCVQDISMGLPCYPY